MKLYLPPKMRLVSGLMILLASVCLAAGVPFGSASSARVLLQSPAPTPLTARERRGKQIYTRGTSPSGKEILAYLGESSFEVPASAMPCANCHGLDGQGKPEGGVTPSNLTWEVLTKPYGVRHADGRQHPPYTEKGLELAITRGVDPAGNRLLNVMPRYVISKEDLADLILYLKRIGHDRDPGLSATEIVIGTTIPTGALADLGQTIKATMTAFFTELNRQGGVYNRRFELKVLETAATPAARRAELERLLTKEPVFALTGAFVAGAEKELIPLIARHEVPLIGPVTLYPQTGFPLNRQIFYVLSGIDGQARALLNFVASQAEFKTAKLAVVYPPSDLNKGVLKAIEDQSKKNKLSEPLAVSYDPGAWPIGATINQLRQAGAEVIFLLGPSEDLLSFMAAADRLSWYPVILQPGAGGSSELFNAPAGFDNKIYFSLPTAPTDQSTQGITEFAALAEKYQLPKKHLAAQFSAYSAAKILVEALRRSGRDVSREKLIETLEGLRQYSTELTPAITYGPNRRVGATGAYVLQLDLKTKRLLAASKWIDSN